MAVLVDALQTRAGGTLGAASLPRHLRRRATSHNPYARVTKHRPNLKRRKTIEDSGESVDAAAARPSPFLSSLSLSLSLSLLRARRMNERTNDERARARAHARGRR